jgi:hypothetical protein
VRSLVRALRERLIPAALTAAGVTLIAAGLLNYSGSAQAIPFESAEPTIVAVTPGESIQLPTLPPLASIPPPSALPSTGPSNRVATRVVVEALGIDLPVVRPKGNTNTYPQCNVAMYIQELFQPGSGKATYIYAHARDGMFGPIYERAIQKRFGGPKSMVGMAVEVYTSDDLVFLYQVSKILLHQLTLAGPFKATTEQLWLQTSEGPKGTPGKTQLLADFVLVSAADHKAAHPVAHPVSCG